MKLKTYNPETLPSAARVGVPKISLNRKSGIISFSRESAKILNIKAGSKVSFHEDESEEQWYLSINNDGYALREKSSGSLAFNSSSLIQLIYDSVSYVEDSGYMLLGKEPVTEGKQKYWPLITGTLKNK